MIIFTDKGFVASRLPKAEVSANKYSVGTALAAVGSDMMTGAGYLAAKGALYSGVGLLYLASEPEALSVYKNRLAEPVFCDLDLNSVKNKLSGVRAAVFGCGVSITENNYEILEYILREATCPFVLDASALTMLSKRPELLSLCDERAVLTPHEGEMSRITGFSAEEIRRNREGVALDFCRDKGCTVILKGHHSIIVQKGKAAVNPTGCAGMAKGGYGDLLSGILCGLLSRGLSPYDAAVCGAYIHGRAGELCAERYTEFCSLPTLAAELLPQAFSEL